jgi:hypothetical protein
VDRPADVRGDGLAFDLQFQVSLTREEIESTPGFEVVRFDAEAARHQMHHHRQFVLQRDQPVLVLQAVPEHALQAPLPHGAQTPVQLALRPQEAESEVLLGSGYLADLSPLPAGSEQFPDFQLNPVPLVDQLGQKRIARGLIPQELGSVGPGLAAGDGDTVSDYAVNGIEADRIESHAGQGGSRSCEPAVC